MASIFLDTNVILIHSVKISLPDGRSVEHKHHKLLEVFFRALTQAIQKNDVEIISSLTVFKESEDTIDRVVEDSIEKKHRVSAGYLDFLSLIRNKARKRLKNFLELVNKPSIDVKERDQIKEKKIRILHNKLLVEGKIPLDRRWSEGDMTILADATYLLQKKKYAPFYFSTMETCLVVGKKKDGKTVHIQNDIYSSLGFNTYHPTEIIRLI